MGTAKSQAFPRRFVAGNMRKTTEACLFRYFRMLSPKYKTLGWNELPGEFGISPITANRKFREWTKAASGSSSGTPSWSCAMALPAFGIMKQPVA